MKTKILVQEMLSDLIKRKNVLYLVFDRGYDKNRRIRKGKKIENWIITEMLVKLLKLQNEGEVNEAMGEYPYNTKKTSKYERCDFWWKINNENHLLEVKTIAPHDNKTPEDIISTDFKKIKRLRPPFVFHHLSMIFLKESHAKKEWEKRLKILYKQEDFFYEKTWNYKIKDEKTLLCVLYTLETLS